MPTSREPAPCMRCWRPSRGSAPPPSRPGAAKDTMASPWRWLQWTSLRRQALERRDFMTSAIAMAGAALSGGEGHALAQPAEEFYLLRKFTLQTGPQLA